MTWTASLLFLLLPGLLWWLQKRISLIEKLSPAFWAYVTGILLGTIFSFDTAWVNSQLEIFVALAIPLLLFSADIRAWLRLAPRTLLGYALYILVVFVCVGANVLFWQAGMPDAALRGAMATGVYTGGTANMAAIHVALTGPPALFAELNFTDLVIGGSFLLLLLSVVPAGLRRLLPPYNSQSPNSSSSPHTGTEATGEPDKALKTRAGKIAFQAGISLLGAGIVLAVSFGLSLSLWGEANGTFIIVALTLLGLLASLLPRVRRWPMSYETGDYLFMAFCVAAGAQIDLLTLWENDWSQAGFMLTAFLSILLLFTLVAWLFRIDADTAVICLTAGIYGPPFIGPVARALGNREIVIAGMTMGVIGLALGNFAGLILYNWLSP